MTEEDPTTQELRFKQREREDEERERAERAAEEDDTAQHEARAKKAGYLAEKLEERAQAEREASRDEDDIREVKSDWESKKGDSQVPGALEEDDDVDA